MSGFRINGRHINDDFPYLRLVERSLPHPEEIPIKDSVIGMHGDYDFAIAIYGERLLENRELTYVFTGKETNESRRLFDKTMLENWLITGSYVPLYDDKDPLYYYLARCVAVELEADNGVSKTNYNIVFDAYPYRIKRTTEGSPYWDDYDISDYYQETKFEVNGLTTITLINNGTKGVPPEIITSGEFTIIKDGYQYVIPAGRITIDDFRLEVGNNEFTVNGNGTIKFNWHKEVI